MTPNAERLLKERYCHKNEQPKDVYKRVANALSLGDRKYENQLTKAMTDGYFLPNSPCIRNAGFKNGLLHACFALGIADEMESITNTLKNTMMIFQYGGGVGINFSALRPHGASLTRGGTSSGVISFMELFDTTTGVVKQSGLRRGAIMGILDYNHAEIMEFIRSKLIKRLTNFNISVMVTDEFMNKVEKGEDIELKDPHNNQTIAIANAKTIFDVISFCSWSSGDPGILFYDRINKDNKRFPELKINTTNPCSESPLPVNGACCLGSINVSKFVKRGQFDFKEFKKYVILATRTLRNMNAVSFYPLPEIAKLMKELDPVGVGVMGFADALIKLGIYYDSPECLDFIDKLCVIYKETTEAIAPNCFWKRIIAPTGSLSILADCSSGIEPIFDTSFERHLSIGIIEESRHFYNSKYVRTAHQISPEWHLKVLAQWQKWIDGGISKTINMPYNASVDDVRNIFLSAWKMGVKGVTVYRDNCKTEQVLYRKQKCEGDNCHL